MKHNICYIIICIAFIQLGANIYDNPSYLKIMKYISNTRVIRRLRKVAQNDYYLYRICMSVRKVHLCSHWTNFRTFYTGPGGGGEGGLGLELPSKIKVC